MISESLGLEGNIGMHLLSNPGWVMAFLADDNLAHYSRSWIPYPVLNCQSQMLNDGHPEYGY